MISPFRERVVRDCTGGICGMVAILDDGVYKARPLYINHRPRRFDSYDDAKGWILSLSPTGTLPYTEVPR